MDVKFINPVLDAIVNVLETMAQIKPQIGTPRIKTNNKALGVVTGVIAMKGAQTTGSIAISFSKTVALDIATRMLRMDFKQVDELVEDLVGEISNMVAGGAKAKLEERGYDFDLTLPQVITGEDQLINHNVDGPTILLPFKTECGDFYIEMCFTQ